MAKTINKLIEELFSNIEFLHDYEENPSSFDLTSNDKKILNLLDNKNKMKDYFDNILRQNVYMDERSETIFNMLVDAQASLRTMNDQVMNIVRPDSMDNETVSRLLEQFGFYQHDLMSTDIKKQFIFDLAHLYKTKGTSSALKSIIRYILFLDTEVVEYWLLRDRFSDELFFRGYPVTNSETAQNIGSIVKGYDEIVDQYWKYTQDKIIELDNLDGKGLPSLSPFFTLAIDLDLKSMIKGISYLNSESVRLLDLYNNNINEYNKYKIWQVGDSQKFLLSPLETLLSACYLYNKRYGRDLPAIVGEKVYSWIRENPEDDSAEFIEKYKELFEEDLIDDSTADLPLSSVANVEVSINDQSTYTTDKYLIESNFELSDNEDYAFTLKEYSIDYHGNRAFISGGEDINTLSIKNELFTYDVYRDTTSITFNELPNISPISLRYEFITNMPKKLKRHNVLYNSQGNNIIVLNGIDEHGDLNRDIFVYSYENDIWSDYENKNPYPSIDGEVKLFPSQGYIAIGPGYDPDNRTYTQCLCILDIDDFEFAIDPDTEVTWGDIDCSGLSEYGRSFYSMYIKDKRIYITGGTIAGNVPEYNYIYDYDTFTWNTISMIPHMNKINSIVTDLGDDILDVGGWALDDPANSLLISINDDYVTNGNQFSDNSIYNSQESLYGVAYLPTNVKYKFNGTGWEVIEHMFGYEADGQIKYLYDGESFSKNPNYTNNRELVMYDTCDFIIKNHDSIHFVNPKEITYNTSGEIESINTTRRLNKLEYRLLSNDDIEVINEGVVIQIEDPENETGRKQKAQKIDDRLVHFAVDNYYMNETNDDNASVLNIINPELLLYLDEILEKNDDELNVVFYQFLSAMDNYCFYKGIRTTFRGIFIMGDDSIIPVVVDNFKPAHSRYAGLALLYTIRDRIGDSLPIDEHFKTLTKHYMEDRYEIDDSVYREVKYIMVDTFGYMNKFDQHYARVPNVYYDTELDQLMRVYESGGSILYVPFNPVLDDNSQEGTDSLRFDEYNIRETFNMKIQYRCPLCGEVIFTSEYLPKDLITDKYNNKSSDYLSFTSWWNNKIAQAESEHTC